MITIYFRLQRPFFPLERVVTGFLLYQLLVAVKPTLEQKGQQKELHQNTACKEMVRNPSASSKPQ